MNTIKNTNKTQYRTTEQFLDIIDSAYNGNWAQAYQEVVDYGFYAHDLIEKYEEEYDDKIPEAVINLIIIAEGAGKLREEESVIVCEKFYQKKIDDLKEKNKSGILTDDIKKNIPTKSGREWLVILTTHPEEAKNLNDNDWDQLDKFQWRRLLILQPQLSDYCDWDKLDGWEWRYLLMKQPQFIDHCDLVKLSGWDWERLLKYQPQLKKYIPESSN